MNERVLILASDREAAAYLYTELSKVVTVAGVVLEEPVGKFAVLRRRIRRFGFISAVGQALFVVLTVPVLRHASRERLKELKRISGLAACALPQGVVHQVRSINSDEAIRLMDSLSPTLVVVYGTRLISPRTLAAIPAPFVNIHAGITPQYRGGNGAYWALAARDREHAGVTVHRIDSGIDTGAILAQKRITPEPRDTFVTYPIIQFGEGTALLRELIAAGPIPAGEPPKGGGKLYAHPTLWGYLYRRILFGIR